MSLNEEQKPPEKGAARPTWELVIEDMKERDQWGNRKYGVHHQWDNGRDHLLDAYQEALDKAVYLRAEIEKRKADPSYSEVLELRGILAAIDKALGVHCPTLEDKLERIAWLRSLVRK